jgi:hypothetical protein
MWTLYYTHVLYSKHLSDLYLLSLYFLIHRHNPFSIVLITLHDSIQGSSTEFICQKSQSIQPSRVQNLLPFHGFKVTE